MFVVWVLTGFWHGASWNFIIWGFYYFVLLAAEKYIFKNKLQKSPKIIGHIYTIFFVLIGWVFFYFEDLSQISSMFKTMFGFGQTAVNTSDYVVLKNNIILFAVCILVSLPIGKFIGKIKNKLLNGVSGTIFVSFASVAYQVAMLAVSISCLVGSTYNPFLYFRF